MSGTNLAANLVRLLQSDVSTGACTAYTLMVLEGRVFEESELARVLGKSDRQARRYLAELHSCGALDRFVPYAREEIYKQTTDSLQAYKRPVTESRVGEAPWESLRRDAEEAAKILGMPHSAQRIAKAVLIRIQEIDGFYVEGILVHAAETVLESLGRIRTSIVGYLAGTCFNMLLDQIDMQHVVEEVVAPSCNARMRPMTTNCDVLAEAWKLYHAGEIDVDELLGMIEGNHAAAG